MIVHLTPAEILQAGIVGLRRRVDSINKKSTDVVGSSNGWENELEGALAEMAVAKALGSFFDPKLLPLQLSGDKENPLKHEIAWAK